MKRLAILIASLSVLGCHKIFPQYDRSGNYTNPPVNTDDVTVTGTTTKDHDSVYVKIKERIVTVDVLLPHTTVWITLTQPDPFDFYDEYQKFQIPQEGVHFGDRAELVNGTLTLYTGTPAAPTGTQYKIHSVAIKSLTASQHELY